MVLAAVHMLPDNVAVPIVLDQMTALGGQPLWPLFGAQRDEKVSIFQQVGVVADIGRQVPGVDHLTVHIDHVGVRQAERREQRKAGRRLVLIEVIYPGYNLSVGHECSSQI